VIGAGCDFRRRDGCLQSVKAGAGIGQRSAAWARPPTKEYRQHFEKDRALVRRFQKIDVNEPTVEDAMRSSRA